MSSGDRNSEFPWPQSLFKLLQSTQTRRGRPLPLSPRPHTMATVATPPDSATRVPSYEDERESITFQKSTPSTLANIITVVRRTWILGFTSFGGPAVHIILLRKKFVEGIEPWLDSKTFADLFALSAALPGPGSTQLLFSIVRRTFLTCRREIDNVPFVLRPYSKVVEWEDSSPSLSGRMSRLFFNTFC